MVQVQCLGSRKPLDLVENASPEPGYGKTQRATGNEKHGRCFNDE